MLFDYNLLKEARKNEGKTKAAVAAYLNIDRSSYSRKEDGLMTFDVRELALVMEFLNIPKSKRGEFFLQQNVHKRNN
ncbi:helix-turn-helix domain-containing protein [Enterococcus hailinensis]|uniref:helix-turn-helix domain-containing protein n=1 Tax=Enterococcus hailinensis TaxID=3238988 RepID=UPI0038B27EC9